MHCRFQNQVSRFIGDLAKFYFSVAKVCYIIVGAYYFAVCFLIKPFGATASCPAVTCGVIARSTLCLLLGAICAWHVCRQ